MNERSIGFHPSRYWLKVPQPCTIIPTGKPVLSPAAILDEAADRAAHEKCAMDLRANEWKPPAPAPRRVVTHKQLGSLLEKIGKLVGQTIRERCERLERKIAELEQKQIKLGGVWKASERYAENTLVSFQGGLWISRADTTARPGSGSPSWRLCVKKGDGAPA